MKLIQMMIAQVQQCASVEELLCFSQKDGWKKLTRFHRMSSSIVKSG
jgi:hypothetical protein